LKSNIKLRNKLLASNKIIKTYMKGSAQTFLYESVDCHLPEQVNDFSVSHTMFYAGFSSGRVAACPQRASAL
jgi:hypothetical protein